MLFCVIYILFFYHIKVSRWESFAFIWVAFCLVFLFKVVESISDYKSDIDNINDEKTRSWGFGNFHSLICFNLTCYQKILNWKKIWKRVRKIILLKILNNLELVLVWESKKKLLVLSPDSKKNKSENFPFKLI